MEKYFAILIFFWGGGGGRDGAGEGVGGVQAGTSLSIFYFLKLVAMGFLLPSFIGKWFSQYNTSSNKCDFNSVKLNG